jgi:hypothetical protein
LKHLNNLYNAGETVNVKATGETVTILKWKYVKNMKRFSYILTEYPGTFYFEEELTRNQLSE